MAQGMIGTPFAAVADNESRPKDFGRDFACDDYFVWAVQWPSAVILKTAGPALIGTVPE